MDHNEFDFNEDLIKPFAVFLRQCSISTDVDVEQFLIGKDDANIDWD